MNSDTVEIHISDNHLSVRVLSVLPQGFVWALTVKRLVVAPVRSTISSLLIHDPDRASPGVTVITVPVMDTIFKPISLPYFYNGLPERVLASCHV